MADDAAATADRRVVRSKDRVLAETYRMLFETGLGGVSVDEVSRRSGVAKTTIYRHWPTRSALVLDACSRMGMPEPAPDTGSLGGDLLALARRVAAQLNGATWPAVLPSIIDAAEREPEVARLQAAMHAGNIQPFLEAMALAQRRGDFPADRDPSLLVAAILGPLFYRRWFSREAIGDDDAALIVAAALR